MTFIIRFLVVAWLSTMVLANAVAKEFDSEKGFKLNLPADWIAIPKQALNQFSAHLKKVAPDAARPQYDFGFQLRASQNWFEYPYILVQVKNNGRLPESELKNLKKIESGLNQGASEAENRMSALLTQAQIGETFYDERSQRLWATMSINVADVGMVKSLLVFFLTERGMIAFGGYAKEADFAYHSNVFESIINSVSLADNLRYQPRWTDALPGAGRIDWGRIFKKALIGAVIGAIIGAIFTVIMRRRKKA